ncbi:MAG: hypothetical protein FWC66_01520 [Oscillospiraceae bacterium]|nr:hypothetical protein [Oscillospiraceae bacterium]
MNVVNNTLSVPIHTLQLLSVDDMQTVCVSAKRMKSMKKVRKEERGENVSPKAVLSSTVAQQQHEILQKLVLVKCRPT